MISPRKIRRPCSLNCLSSQTWSALTESVHIRNVYKQPRSRLAAASGPAFCTFHNFKNKIRQFCMMTVMFSKCDYDALKNSTN